MMIVFIYIIKKKRKKIVVKWLYYLFISKTNYLEYIGISTMINFYYLYILILRYNFKIYYI